MRMASANSLGDEWFAEELQRDQDPLLTTINERQPWFYQKDPKYVPAIAGFYKNYGKGKFTVDLVTVSGAGHYVPTFRPQQAFQMFYNFLKGERNYTTPGYEQPVPKNFTRRQADQIFELPGATFQWTFNQHAGYLKGIEGNYLHYWLFESQANPDQGSAHPLAERRARLLVNVYSWNRAANLLFLEAPRGVGFSWQDPNVSNDTTYSDELTIEDNYLAIKDFFEVHPQYLKRDFYVAARVGIYGPTLTRRLIDGIIAGDLQDVNLVGMVIGNGELSAVEQLRSNGPLMYHRGLLGKNEWDKMVTCCGGDYNQLEFCDVTRFVYLDDAGNAQPISNDSDCDVYMAKIVQKEWTTAELLDVYNIYQDCYQQKAFVFGSKNMRRQKERIRESLVNDPEPHIFAQRSVNSIWNTFSTDNQGGFPCYASAAAQNWLNSVDVRKALHVPSYVQNWTDCNDDINQNYIQQYNSTDDVFDDIINSGLKLRILVYNGDLDLACNMIGDQWFIEKTAARNGLSVSKKHTAWQVRNQIAGYAKQFANDQVTIDLLTVKVCTLLCFSLPSIDYWAADIWFPTDRPEAALQMILNFISHRDFNASNIYSLKPKDLLLQYQREEKLAEALGLPSPLDIPGSGKQQMKAETEGRAEERKAAVNLTKLKANFPLTNHYAGKLQVQWPNAGIIFSTAPFSLNDTSNGLRSDFYITGESYGGVYVPLLAQALLESIQNETDTRFSQLNFRGFAIGNGLLSKPLQLNTAVHLLYYRGFFDLDTYKDVLSCCPIGAQDPYGSWQPCDFSQRSSILGFNAVWASGNSVYNTYQDCWDDENSAYSAADSHNRKKRAATFPTVPPLLNPYGFIDQAKLINKKSSDPFGGYQCWAGEGTYNYLNTPSIQDALGVA
ncbi:Carboxypeptidase [Aphelenchoides fujianensis]|nr:Carboxypeptidase [Aphelenchoides fujianensis]